MLNRRLALLAAVLPFAATAAAAQAPPAPLPMFDGADADAAKAVIDRYFDRFSVRDFAAFRDVFNAPFLMGGRELAAIPTVDQVMERYQAIRATLDKADYAASKAAEIRLTPLRGDSALANVHWRRFKKDGGLLNEGAEVLLLAKVAGQWKITGVLPEDLRQFRAGA